MFLASDHNNAYFIIKKCVIIICVYEMHSRQSTQESKKYL